MNKIFLIESIQREHNTELIIFSRDKKGEKEIKKVSDFRPYFYVPEDESIPDNNSITGVETGHMSITGKPVKKIFVKKSVDVPKLREKFSKHYEADIQFTQRYIIDEIKEPEIYSLKILSLDIETNGLNTFPNIENPDQEVISCAFCNNKGVKKVLLYQSDKSKEQLKNNKTQLIYNTEENLLRGILAYVKKEDPDVITGWNVEKFDLIYLIRRMSKLNIDYKKLSPLNIVTINKQYEDVTIKGRVILDMMKAYEYFRRVSNQGRAESYSLEFTAQDILDKGKIKHKESFHDMWVNNPETLMKYNLRDAELVIEINNKLEIIDFFNYLRAKSYAQLNQVFWVTSLIDGYLLRNVHNKMVLPSKTQNNGTNYLGAYVFSPIPGLYNNIITLDLKALYPNIIRTFNISYETICPEGEIKLKEGVSFIKKQGIIPKAMVALAKERKYFKNLMYNAKTKEDYKLNYYKQYAVKVLQNSFYGYIGFPGSRLYKKEVAEAVTTWGQLIIKHSKKVLNNIDYTVIYGDTDSAVFDTKIDIKENDTDYTTYKIGELFEESIIDGEIVKKDTNNYIVIPKKQIFTPSVDTKTQKIIHNKINYIMGHKVKKKLFKIKIGDNETAITEDHSIMVKRNGEIIEVKPIELLKTDKLLVRK